MTDRETRVIVIATMLAGLVAVQAGPAHAQTASVRYHAHELQTAAGTKSVMARIERASKNACWGPTIELFKGRRQCTAELAGQIVGKIGDRGLSALLAGRADTQMASRAE